MFSKKMRLMAFLSVFSIFGIFAQMEIDTFIGSYTIDDEVIEKVVDSHIMQRIKGVDQHGPAKYYSHLKPFSRFDHCLGVWLLLHKFGAPHVEQVAGLLHDASHTAFSHVGDHLFDQPNGHKSYQDLVHLEFLEAMGIAQYLEDHGIALGYLDPDLEEYTALEQDLPDLCADRIQYIIQTGMVFDKITQEQAKAMVNALHFEKGTWFFDDVEQALPFARLSIHFTRTFWTSEDNYVLYQYFARALRRAVALGLIVEDDIKYGTDQTILDIIYASEDQELQMLLAACENLEGTYEVVPYGAGQENVKPKCRAVNPLIKVDDTLLRLTEVSDAYAAEYADIKAWCATGYGINFIL